MRIHNTFVVILKAAYYQNFPTHFSVEEVLNFVQQDLVADDVMLLDVGDALFVWLGIHSNQQVRNAKNTGP